MTSMPTSPDWAPRERQFKYRGTREMVKRMQSHSHKRETARRLKQLQRHALIGVTHAETGFTALGRYEGGQLAIQADDIESDMAHGWHRQPPGSFYVDWRVAIGMGKRWSNPVPTRYERKPGR